MKMELNKKPDKFNEIWPGQYEIFSWMEYVTAIPQPIFLITTYKENQIPNACLHAWSTFSGEGENYYTIISILKNTHTYKNILEENEFCLNFPDYRYIELCFKTIKNNELNINEIENSGFTIENSKEINTPRIKECFLNMECTFEWQKDYFNDSKWVVICGKIINIAMEEDRLKKGLNGRYSDLGYIYNIHSPKNPINGKSCEDEIGKIEIFKKNR